MGIQQATLGSGWPYVNPLPGGTVNGYTAVSALVNVNTNGTITFYTTYPTLVTQNWYTPTTTGVGTGHYVRFVVTSGDALHTGSSSYVEVSSNRSAGFNIEITSSAVVRIDIATDSGGTNVVCSGSYTINMVI